jgi:hypothetical protein
MALISLIRVSSAGFEPLLWHESRRFDKRLSGPRLKLTASPANANILKGLAINNRCGRKFFHRKPETELPETASN